MKKKPYCILGVQFIALAFIVLSVVSHFETGEINRYLPVGPGLTCTANFALALYAEEKIN